MIIAEVYKDGKLVDKGIVTSGKKWVKEYPEQYVGIVTDTGDYSEQERNYSVEEGYRFKEFQDNGNGWEMVYDSDEKIDRSVDYDLPAWFVNASPIPNITHKMDEEGNIEEDFKGYIR